jgi:hypothetical protein
LGGLIADIKRNPSQVVFNESVLSDPPSGKDSSWNDKTDAAFAQYAVAAGLPEAGKNWASFAKKNDYEPTMFGIYKFWENTIGKVLEKNAPPSASVAPSPSASVAPSPSAAIPSAEGEPQTLVYNNQAPASPSSPTLNVGPLKRRIYNTLTGGSGVQIGVPDQSFFSTLHGRIARAIESVKSEGAKTWFSQEPAAILPDSLVDTQGSNKFNQNGIQQFLVGNGITNPEIVSIYQLMLDASIAARKSRSRSRSSSAPR